MKKILLLSVLMSLALICSCQKQDSAAEAQLVQRKTQLDERAKALDEREKALERRETAVAEREKALADSRIAQPQRQAVDAGQAEADRQRRIEQLPPELRALIPDQSRIQAAKANKSAAGPDRATETQRGFGDSLKKKMAVGGMAPSAAQAAEPDSTSPSPSPTP